MTVWVSKGLQYPIVYLPFAFNRWVPEPDLILFHDGPTRCLHVGGKDSPDYREVEKLGREESAGDDSRLTYVALTRAQAQVVAWWSPARDEPNGGLSRLLRGRRPGESVVPEQVRAGQDQRRRRARPAAAVGGRRWPRARAVGADACRRRRRRAGAEEPRRQALSPLDRHDVAPHLVFGADPRGRDVGGEQRARGRRAGRRGRRPAAAAAVDRAARAVADGRSARRARSSARWCTRCWRPPTRSRRTWPPSWRPTCATTRCGGRSTCRPPELAAALVPMHDTPLGPLAADLTLRQIGLRDRLREMDFEFPLAGGDMGATAPGIHLRDVGDLVAEYLPADDPLASYAERLTGDALGNQPLRGYLNGSVDAVLRIPDGGVPGGHRYVVVDYKSNWLGDGDGSLTSADYERARLVEAMLHSDYPLQALLYSVVLHRFLRWRQPGYDPDRHLGGVLYLFVRGMCGPDTPVVDGHRCRGVRLAAPGVADRRGVRAARRREGRRVTSVEPVDTASWRRAVGASGLLAAFNEAAVIDSADVLVAQRLSALAKETDERVMLAVALVVRGLRARFGMPGSAVRRGPGRRRRPALARDRRTGWRRCGPARCSSRRTCCAARNTCSTSTGTGGRRSRSPTTCGRWCPAGPSTQPI